MSVTARVLQAIGDELDARRPLLEAMRGGTVSVIVQIDPSGEPKQITFRTEERRTVERKRACRTTG